MELSFEGFASKSGVPADGLLNKDVPWPYIFAPNKEFPGADYFEVPKWIFWKRFEVFELSPNKPGFLSYSFGFYYIFYFYSVLNFGAGYDIFYCSKFELLNDNIFLF
jgi:hypothetical protein